MLKNSNYYQVLIYYNKKEDYIVDIIELFKEKAKAVDANIVLPEGSEPRTLKAARIIKKEDITNITLLGDREEIEKEAANINIDLTGIQIINPKKSDKKEEYAKKLFELRKAKGLTLDEARNLVEDELYYGTMMVKLNDAQGMVAGAINKTSDVLRPALQIIKTDGFSSSVSGAFIMIVPDCEFGQKGVLVFADCAVNPSPTAKELSEIAYQSAQTADVLIDMDPKVAFLSFSTKGSATDPKAQKVAEALEIARKNHPELVVDGELQLDAAIVPIVAELKAPNSPVAGQANVLVFPDLESGNIGYKLVHRFAKADVVGPILQGLAKPVNDLSRGSNVRDIVNTILVTVLQSTKEVVYPIKEIHE